MNLFEKSFSAVYCTHMMMDAGSFNAISRIRPKEAEQNEMLYHGENGIEVKVAWKEFKAKNEKVPENERAIIFLPGIAARADGENVGKLATAFADRSGRRVYAVTSSSEQIHQPKLGANERDPTHFLSQEANAISQLIKDKGLTDVTLVGHSKGGIKAIDIAYNLKTDKSIKIDGLVLLNSLGLYDQSPEVESYVKQRLAVPVASNNPDLLERIRRELKSQRISDARIAIDVDEMSDPNMLRKHIEVPVLVIMSKKDRFSDPARAAEKYGGTWKTSMFRHSSNSKVLVAEEGTHDLPYEHTSWVVDSALDFLAIKKPSPVWA